MKVKCVRSVDGAITEHFKCANKEKKEEEKKEDENEERIRSEKNYEYYVEIISHVNMQIDVASTDFV